MHGSAVRPGSLCSVLAAALLVLVRITTAAEPVNPDLSPEARAVLGYLHEQSGQKILSAQHGDTKEYEYVHDVTGKYAAIWGTDLIFDRRNARRMNDVIGWWKKGVIPTAMWHWGAPTKGEGYDQSKLKIDVNQCFVDGTPEHAEMWADLTRIADDLTVLRDAHVPVLWRPMHECSGGWFWYDKSGGPAFQKLWRTTYDYFTKERKLNNLIWVLCYDGSPSEKYDPGSQYYDIVATDTYDAKTDAHSKMFKMVQSVGAPDKLIAFHECATPPDPAVCLEAGANWSWFMNWDQHVFKVDKAYLTKVYQSDAVITLDELPDWAARVAQQKAAAIRP